MNERLAELEAILDEKCGIYANDCNTCPYYEQCEEYQRLKREQSYE